MRLTTILFALFFGICASLASATAAEVNYWRTPGLHPLSTSVDGRDPSAIACAIKGLNMPADVAQKFTAATSAGMGPTVHISDDTYFSRMTYAECAVWGHIVPRWSSYTLLDSRMEVIKVTADNGTVWTFGRPFLCDNWAIIDIAPQHRSNCFRVHFDYSTNSDVDMRTVADLKATGHWQLNEAQAYLNEDTPVSFNLLPYRRHRRRTF